MWRKKADFDKITEGFLLQIMQLFSVIKQILLELLSGNKQIISQNYNNHENKTPLFCCEK